MTHVGREPRDVPLAIVGMACRLPGADGPDDFWRLLIDGQSAIGELPSDRFDRDLYYDSRRGVRGKSYTDRGAIVSWSADDVEGSSLPPAAARKSDVCHRFLCDVAAEAFRDARLDPYDLPERNAGVYIGHTIASDRAGDASYALGIEDSLRTICEDGALGELDPSAREWLIQELAARVRAQGSADRAFDPNLAPHMAAGVISKSFGLTGPFVCVNAACASSLQALVLAGRALQHGTIDLALVGGASICSRDWLVLFSQSTALSPAGSRPFDQDADGLVVAEAYVAVVVKTLEKALADGSPIHAVIRGMGVSADGKGRSLWAPRSEGQVAAIRRAYGPSVDPADIQYIEAHATATQLGDATEIESLTEAFAQSLPAGTKIPIASVKANIGHALESAGLVGVLKTVLCLQNGLIPKAINIETLNPKVDWDAVPFYVPLETVDWPKRSDGKPRRAAVNAFGIGGLNAHVVLEEFVESRPTNETRRRQPPDHAEEAIAIIGLGCVLPNAGNVAEFSDWLRSDEDSLANRSIEGFKYDWRRHRIAPKEIELADPLQFMTLEAADQALSDAGYDVKDFDRKRTGVVIGAEFTGAFYHRLQLTLRVPQTQELVRELLIESGVSTAEAEQMVDDLADVWHARWPLLADNTGSFSASSLAVRIAKCWDFMGNAAALDSGATSGMAALVASMDLLRAGDCDMIVCGAAHRHPDLAVGEVNAAETADDGAVVVLLKRLGDARRDGDRVHALIGGVAACHDAPTRAVARSLNMAVGGGVDRPEFTNVFCNGAPEGVDRLLSSLLDRPSDQRRREQSGRDSTIHKMHPTGAGSALVSLLAAVLSLSDATRGTDAEGAADLNLTTDMETRPRKSAVLSQGKGLAYCAVIQEAPPQASHRLRQHFTDAVLSGVPQDQKEALT